MGAGEPLAPLTSAPNTARREREALALNMIHTPKGRFEQARMPANIENRERDKYALPASKTLAGYANFGT